MLLLFASLSTTTRLQVTLRLFSSSCLYILNVFTSAPRVIFHPSFTFRRKRIFGVLLYERWRISVSVCRLLSKSLAPKSPTNATNGVENSRNYVCLSFFHHLSRYWTTEVYSAAASETPNRQMNRRRFLSRACSSHCDVGPLPFLTSVLFFKVKVPILFVAAEYDQQCPADKVREAVDLAHDAKLSLHYNTHFDMYLGETLEVS